MSGRGRSGVVAWCVGLRIILTSARTTPSVYPDIGDCGEGGRDEILFVCVVLFCVLLSLRRKPNINGTERKSSPTKIGQGKSICG